VSLKKSHTFVAGLVSLLGIYFTTLFVAPGVLDSIGPAVIFGVVGACGFYQGANVADNWQRSKYFKKDLVGVPSNGTKGVP
jgi:hypothetical protein